MYSIIGTFILFYYSGNNIKRLL